MARGTVRFFNPAKGFGFIASDTGEGDVFVHVTALHASGLSNLDEGDVVIFELEADRRSGRTSAVDLELVEKAPPGGGARPPRAFTGAQASRDRSQPTAIGAGSGTVKWFNGDKGFGFITPTAGGEDVFVHATSLRQAGIDHLQDGQAVTFDLERNARTGKMSATNLRLA
ncbi:MAG: cold shock domain-containing protein [Brevundimonas sp.]|nr:cold shock domain-containing protein [Brevundimonas sp.]